MSAEPEQARLGLDSPRGTEDDISVRVVGPSLFEMWEPAGQTFDADELHEFQASRRDLVRELVGMVEVRSREPVRVLPGIHVAAIDEVTFDDVTEARVEEELPYEAVEQRCEPADGCNGDEAVGLDDAAGLGESREAIRLLGQVIQRSEKEHHIEAVVGER